MTQPSEPPRAVTTYGMYFFCLVVWGANFYAVKQQAGPVPLEVSLIYRLIAADVIFFAVLLMLRRNLRFGLKNHLAMAAFGFGNFAGSYGLLYTATAHMTSGLVSVIFSTKVLMTTINMAIFLRRPLEKEVIVGGILGLVGIGLIFLPQLQGIAPGHISLWGFALALLGTFVTSLGDVFSARNSKAGIPPLQANAFGFLYAILFLTIWVAFRGLPIRFATSPRYLGALLYLTLLGSVGAWIMYLELIARIGPARSGYMVALFPTVGIAVSALLEGLKVTPYMMAGVTCAVLGNGIAMMRRAPPKQGSGSHSGLSAPQGTGRAPNE